MPVSERISSTPASATSGCVCKPIPLRRVGNGPIDRLAACPAPQHRSSREMIDAFLMAPQFSMVDVSALFSVDEPRPLRIVLLTQNGYYARQAAVYLALIASHLQDPAETGEDEWQEAGLDDEEIRAALGMNGGQSLLVVHPSLLDGASEQGNSSSKMALPMAGQHAISIDDLDASAVLIAADSGTVLTEAVLQQLRFYGDAAEGKHIFVALKPGQDETKALDELLFMGYTVCRIGVPGAAYEELLLRTLAAERGCSIAVGVDVRAVLRALKARRGERYDECDIEQLLRLACRSGKTVLDTAALTVPSIHIGRSGRDELDGMPALDNVKDVLARILAANVRAGKKGQLPAYSSMAFAGAPGTGKSVTARLVAKIMNEEGCGSGRFVEAGREQLIGEYLGQTSPMVAKLFERAAGGVLFIDEAGSLLDASGQDSYAKEAVAALVRHMELHPETTVIFATYPGEMEHLLHTDRGLSSRVSRIVKFNPYSNEQLWDILACFAEKNRETIPMDARGDCFQFFDELRRRKGEDFGNAREVRRLFEFACEELALRSTEASEQLRAEDLSKACERMLAQEKPQTAKIGFSDRNAAAS